MPLRSVEAASRDDAIAAAREQFGPTARVVGVRRVRSGGVLGFFATERYVAEVDPDAPVRPATGGFPASDVAPRADGGRPRNPVIAASLEERARRAAESIARFTATEDDRVDEFADLLAAEPTAEPAPTYTRSTFAKVAAESAKQAAAEPAAAAAAKATRKFTPEPVKPVSAVREWPTVETDDEGPVVPAPGESGSPSPFTAALARMVSGDREVRQAVQDALAEPEDDPRDSEPARPNWAAIVRAAEKTAQSGAAHQEEEPVDEQAEQSTGVRPAVFPSWVAEEPVAEPAPVVIAEAPAPPSSPREEVVADILRAALAQGQSDEALADILRTVLSGSAGAAVAAPVELPVEPVVEPVVIAEPVVAEPVAVAAPVVAEPAVSGWERVPEPQLWAEPVAAPAPAVQEVVEEVHLEEEPVAEVAMSSLARTASDPAPMPLDATTIMPPLSLLPPLPGARRGGGLPPVPPSPARPSASSSASTPAADAPTTSPMPSPATSTPLATVVRLPFAPLPDVDFVEPSAPAARRTEVEETPMPPFHLAEAFVEDAAEPVAELPAEPVADVVVEPEPTVTAPLPAVPATPGDVADRLLSYGVPAHLLGAGFAADAAAHGTYAALTAALAARLPVAPALPTGPGEVLFLIGPGVETLRAARSLAAALRLDPERVQWATRGDLAALAPKSCRMTTIEAAIDRRQDAARAGTMTIVAVDAPLRTDAYWMSQMLAIWTPSAVWAVVEATRKPEDLEQWIGGLPRVDALVVQDSDLSADPAAVLDRVDTPVALLDGVPATPHRWASLLCERLETLQA